TAMVLPHDAEVRVHALQKLPSAVVRAVVNDDHLHANVLRREGRGDGVADVARRIEGRNDDADPRHWAGIIHGQYIQILSVVSTPRFGSFSRLSAGSSQSCLKEARSVCSQSCRMRLVHGMI